MLCVIHGLETSVIELVGLYSDGDACPNAKFATMIRKTISNVVHLGQLTYSSLHLEFYANVTMMHMLYNISKRKLYLPKKNFQKFKTVPG